ncbi:MAG TPA: response regulator transcription factor [Chryseosolibacter sp.]|nr:response regulator transcription factor [Chryseosolibacter sp.]
MTLELKSISGYLEVMNNPTKSIKVVLVDDHRIILDGLKSLLESDPDFSIIASLGSAEEVFDFLNKDQPDILLTDYSLPGMTGLDLFKKLKPLYPKMKVAVLSMHDEASLVRSVLKEGVNGYLLKNIQQFELKNALKQISMGYPYVSPEITKIMMSELNQPEQKSELLTEREREILKLIAKEFSNKQMAEKLFISERTVETHRKNIFRKTNTNTLVGLIKFAFENNLV